MLTEKAKDLIKFSIGMLFALFFVWMAFDVFNKWDTTPPYNKIECVEGTIKTEYGNCVLPEEYNK